MLIQLSRRLASHLAYQIDQARANPEQRTEMERSRATAFKNQARDITQDLKRNKNQKVIIKKLKIMTKTNEVNKN